MSKFKKMVEARMAKTGESWSTAAGHVRNRRSMRKDTFEPHRYAAIKKFAFIRILDGERLVGVIRPPPQDTAMGQLRGERSDHWRVDCGEPDFDLVTVQDLKKAVADYLGTDKVSVFWPWSGWTDKNNTEPYPPGEDWRSKT